jgi:hypothetical protein
MRQQEESEQLYNSSGKPLACKRSQLAGIILPWISMGTSRMFGQVQDSREWQG